MLVIFEWNENIESVKIKLAESGLFFASIENPPFRNESQTANWAIAKTEEVANHVAILFGSTPSSSEELGKYMGYPQSSVDAYMGKIEKFGNSDPFEDINTGFLEYCLSKDNWREEIKTAQRWEEALRTKAPAFYQESLTHKPTKY